MILKRFSIIFQPWKIENGVINIGGAINLQVGHVYTETHCIYKRVHFNKFYTHFAFSKVLEIGSIYTLVFFSYVIQNKEKWWRRFWNIYQK